MTYAPMFLSLLIQYLQEMLDDFFVHPSDKLVLLNIKVGLNSLSDVFIHRVPYGLRVESFFFSLGVVELANLAKQILRKQILQGLNAMQF